jgi:hypothetical protein
MWPADALVVAPSHVAYRAITSSLIVLHFAQQRCTSEIVSLASSSRDGRRSFQETPAHAGARQPCGAGEAIASPLATRCHPENIVRVVSTSCDVRLGRHACFHGEANAMERMRASARCCRRSLVDWPRRLSGGHTRSQSVRGGRSRPSVCGVSRARGALVDPPCPRNEQP